MKKKTSSGLRVLVKVLCFAAFLGCSESVSPDPDFVPDLARLWADGDDNHFKHRVDWSYAPDCPTSDPCETEGFFSGTDTYRKNNATFNCNLAGSFKNHRIEWFYPKDNSNFDCPIKGAYFSGTINDASTVITVNSTTLGALRLEKR